MEKNDDEQGKQLEIEQLEKEIKTIEVPLNTLASKIEKFRYAKGRDGHPVPNPHYENLKSRVEELQKDLRNKKERLDSLQPEWVRTANNLKKRAFPEGKQGQDVDMPVVPRGEFGVKQSENNPDGVSISEEEGIIYEGDTPGGPDAFGGGRKKSRGKKSRRKKSRKSKRRKRNTKKKKSYKRRR